MGSRRTHDERLARLREAGLSEEELARLSSPIGLDLGARTPEETAVIVAAEIIAGRWGGTGERLAELAGRIHHEPVRRSGIRFTARRHITQRSKILSGTGARHPDCICG